MSIVRVGMSESKTYGDGYEAIFGAKKKPAPETKVPVKPAVVDPKPAKKGKKA